MVHHFIIDYYALIFGRKEFFPAAEFLCETLIRRNYNEKTIKTSAVFT